MTTNAFGKAIAAKRAKQSYRVVAPDIGINFSVLARIEHGQWPCVKSFIKLVRWLEIPPDRALEMLDEPAPV